MTVQVDIDVDVGISFGLESQMTELTETIKTGIKKVKEFVMKIAFVNTCVWCGVAFLQGHGETLSIRARAISMHGFIYLVRRNVERFESFPLHHFIGKLLAILPNKRIKSDSVNLSAFLQKHAKKSPSLLRSLCGRSGCRKIERKTRDF